jgi:hypothetical protein
MYVIATESGTVEFVASSGNGVFLLASMLEASERTFTVSSRCGKLKPDHFDFGNFSFWKQGF